MKSEFLPEAEAEFREATRYYEKKAPGVGMAFIRAVRRSVELIGQNPYAAVDIGDGIRRKVLHRFPFNLIYTVEVDSIVIIALAHQKRRPNYWKERYNSH